MTVSSFPRTGLMAILLFLLLPISPAAPADDSAPAYDSPRESQASSPANDNTYDENEIVQKASDFFGATTQAVGDAVEKVFSTYGRPNAYIVGNEGSGAFVVGLRYGVGDLFMKRTGAKATKVYWQGPSVGFDFGGNASKTFTLVYNLPNADAIYQRFPGVEGSLYVVAGIGVNYQQAGNIVVAPMRTGVGLRAAANVGYLAYSRERNWLPF